MNETKSFFAPLRIWKNLGKKPVTIPFKDIFDNPREAAERYRGFHINDWDKCVGCGTCSEICPTNCIVMIPQEQLPTEKGKKKERPAFDYGRCSFCALCVDICVSDSLGMSREYIHLSVDPDSFYFLPGKDGIHETTFQDGYLRDETSELLDLTREEMGELPHEEWTGSFLEIVKGYSKEQAISEASRCVECGVCTQTCPAHMHIPEYIKSVYQDNTKEGMEYLYRTNPFSNVCGRICTHLCETACVIGNRGEPIAIRWLKRYLVDAAPDDMYKEIVMASVTAPTNGKVAIIGAGPAGLSAGYYLRGLGYAVDVYEEMPLPGGVMRYGIPAYRLPEDKIARDIEFIEKTGVSIHLNQKIGKDLSLAEIQKSHDAVFAASGLWTPKKLSIIGVEHPEIKYSTSFLAEARDYARGQGKMPEITESAIVFGGGDVSFDVARTLIRLQKEKYGEAHVHFVARKPEEYLAASREEVVEGRQEGLEYHFELLPDEILFDENNHVKGMTACRCSTECDEKGVLATCPIDGPLATLYATQFYLTVGSDPEFGYFPEDLRSNVPFKRGKIVVNQYGQVEGLPWLFAGGDIIGGEDVITAIANGHNAAKGIDAYLTGKKES